MKKKIPLTAKDIYTPKDKPGDRIKMKDIKKAFKILKNGR